MTIGTNTVSCVIPLYINHPSLYPIVTDFFRSLKEHYPNFELIVVDDCSPLPHKFPVTIRNDVNLGYTSTVNKGLSLFKGETVLILNDDLKIAQGELDSFTHLLERGIYFPRDTASGNLDQFGAVWGMNRATFQELGFLDESLPHYGSDREYYQRALSKGIPVIKLNDVCIEHKESATYKHTKIKTARSL